MVAGHRLYLALIPPRSIRCRYATRDCARCARPLTLSLGNCVASIVAVMIFMVLAICNPPICTTGKGGENSTASRSQEKDKSPVVRQDLPGAVILALPKLNTYGARSLWTVPRDTPSASAIWRSEWPAWRRSCTLSRRPMRGFGIASKPNVGSASITLPTPRRDSPTIRAISQCFNPASRKSDMYPLRSLIAASVSFFAFPWCSLIALLRCARELQSDITRKL